MSLITNRKKIWVAKVSKFYNRSMKSWLQDNDIEIYSTQYEDKSVVTEKIVKTLKIKLTNIWLQYQKMCALIN